MGTPGIVLSQTIDFSRNDYQGKAQSIPIQTSVDVISRIKEKQRQQAPLADFSKEERIFMDRRNRRLLEKSH